METFILLTRVAPAALCTPQTLESLEQEVRPECTEVKWIANYAVLGPYDYLERSSKTARVDKR